MENHFHAKCFSLPEVQLNGWKEGSLRIPKKDESENWFGNVFRSSFGAWWFFQVCVNALVGCCLVIARLPQLGKRKTVPPGDLLRGPLHQTLTSFVGSEVWVLLLWNDFHKHEGLKLLPQVLSERQWIYKEGCGFSSPDLFPTLQGSDEIFFISIHLSGSESTMLSTFRY